MKSGFFGYLRAAFNARPFGMFVAPNWVGLAAFGLLGLVNPGFWLIGAGLEAGYLAVLVGNARFQRAVDLRRSEASDAGWQTRQDAILRKLPDSDQARYVALLAKCRGILEQQGSLAGSDVGLDAQQEGLGRLAWTYLRLLATRRMMARVLRDGSAGDVGEALESRLSELETRLKAPDLSDELRRSLQAQRDIVAQRLAHRNEGAERLAFLDSELQRIMEQVELLREQAALSADAGGFSARIDEITATLGTTSRWLSDQQRTLGGMEDLLQEPPPLALKARAQEHQ